MLFIAYVFPRFKESFSIFILKETPSSCTCQSHYSTRMLNFDFQCPLLSFPLTSIWPPLEHRNRVCGIRRPRLRHVPMLNKACSVHPVNVCQRNGFLVHLIDTHVDEADVVIEAVAEHYRGDKRDDYKELGVSTSTLFEEPLRSCAGSRRGRECRCCTYCATISPRLQSCPEHQRGRARSN